MPFRNPPRRSLASANRAGYASVSGFTLIELLVVIAIIAILAAILFPVCSGPARRTRHLDYVQRAECHAGVKHVHTRF